MFLDIMVWLRDEDIIRIGQIADDGNGGDFFTDCVITGHGMDLLRRKADVLGGRSAADVIMKHERSKCFCSATREAWGIDWRDYRWSH
jgi:hypothetical protein